MPVLLSNASATGLPVQWGGGRGVFSVVGTFSGATITLQCMGPDGSTYITAATGATAAGVTVFELPPTLIRAAVSGGPPSGIYANADQSKGGG